MSDDLSKKSWDELKEELRKVNASFPSVEKLDGWVPVEIIEEKGVVLARKRILSQKTMKEVTAVKAFKPESIWKEVYDKMLRRKQILDAMNEIAEREDGPASFSPDESAPDDWERAVDTKS